MIKPAYEDPHQPEVDVLDGANSSAGFLKVAVLERLLEVLGVMAEEFPMDTKFALFGSDLQGDKRRVKKSGDMSDQTIYK